MEILLVLFAWVDTASNTLNKLSKLVFQNIITQKLIKIRGRCSWTSYWSLSTSPNQCGKKIPNKNK